MLNQLKSSTSMFLNEDDTYVPYHAAPAMRITAGYRNIFLTVMF